MRNAPSVTYPVGRCAFYGRLLLLLGATGLAAMVGLWLGFPRATWWMRSGALVLWLLWSGFAWWDWRRLPQGRLQWSGRGASDEGAVTPDLRAGSWWWQEGDQPQQMLQRVQWVLDAQSVVLLRLRVGPWRSRWAWLEASRDPARWEALRRALTAHA